MKKPKKQNVLADLPDEQWASHDSATIAKNTGTKLANVRYYRISKGKPKGPRKAGSGRPQTKDLSAFNPTKTDTENASVCQISVTYARKLRVTAQEFC